MGCHVEGEGVVFHGIGQSALVALQSGDIAEHHGVTRIVRVGLEGLEEPLFGSGPVVAVDVGLGRVNTLEIRRLSIKVGDVAVRGLLGLRFQALLHLHILVTDRIDYLSYSLHLGH